jgi:hypothetical protein
MEQKKNVAGMRKKRNPQRFLVGTPDIKTALGRPKRR